MEAYSRKRSPAQPVVIWALPVVALSEEDMPGSHVCSHGWESCHPGVGVGVPVPEGVRCHSCGSPADCRESVSPRGSKGDAETSAPIATSQESPQESHGLGSPSNLRCIC